MPPATPSVGNPALPSHQEPYAITGIQTLATLDATLGGGPLGLIQQATVIVDHGQVQWVGPASAAPRLPYIIDGSGLIGFPGLVDCHTHTVWAGSRADEFRQRLAGAHYSDILEAGGGILSTVRATRAADLETLVDLTAQRLAQMVDRGVTTVEVKSGYGLDPDSERKSLLAARQAGERTGVRVLTTFLGAHTVPSELRGRRDDYVRQVIEEQLPHIADVADFIDVYVDRGAFTCAEGEAILRAGQDLGLQARIHAEQVALTGAAQMAARLGALCADHLERIDSAGIAAMARHGTIAVLLPGAMLYLRDTPPPVDALRQAGVRLAVATDLNPGSSPVHDLWTCATLACLTMGLTVEEAIGGITTVAADALGQSFLGRVKPGYAADIALFRPPIGEPADPTSLIQHMGGHQAEWVVREGRILRAPSR